MHYMGLNEIREKYLSFFESKGHLRLPSFPLIPRNDKSILLINAGMTPLKPYFTGQETPPRTRVTTCQKCIRTPDIERVGITARHGTFFEMLGNFSFGDYFKHEATAWAWEFCTKVMELPVDKLYVTVYQDDDEAYDIWTKEIGVDPSHVSRLGKEDNFWEHGSGPCGPCSEIYFDRGPEKGCGKPDCKVGCDCDRYVEFWNLVFTQFDNDGNGNYSRLAKCNIDTGMGLERLACIMQGVDSLFDVDTIRNVTNRLSEMSSVKYGDSKKTDISLRVITDHIRSTTFMVCDGVLPSNEGRGYVLRRLLRRAARHGKLLGIKEEHFLCELADVVIRESCSAYPDLKEKAEYIKKIIELEENRFNQTLDNGLSVLAEVMDRSEKVIDGQDAFKLYDTFGFPLDLTKEIAAEKGFEVDEAGFDTFMKEQKKRARDAHDAKGGSAWKDNDVFEGVPETVFKGYNALELDSSILAVVKEGKSVTSADAGDEVMLVLDETPFYAESGGQVGDIGMITTDSGKAEVKDCKKTNNKYIHYCTVTEGSIEVGTKAHSAVCSCSRNATMKNHSAAHLLQAALRQVLGSHIAQAGSYVDPYRMRFDFSHFEAMTPEQIRQVETIVNESIMTATPVSITEMGIEEAKAAGATALFGEKYGDIVRVVKMGDISMELCGGTHVPNTGCIGSFRIIAEQGIAAGVRRIEALTGLNAVNFTSEKADTVSKISGILKCSIADVAEKAAAVTEELKAANKQILELNTAAAEIKLEKYISEAKEVNGKLLIIGRIDAKADILRDMTLKIKDKIDNAVCCLASVDNGKVSFSVSCGEKAVKAGAHAGNLVKKAAQICGGGGGGKPDTASAGGKDPTKLEEALKEIENSL